MTVGLFSVIGFYGENNNEPRVTEWKRVSQNPIYRDLIPNENYQAASDAHVFFDENNQLRMIYTGDKDGKPAIKLASGSSWTEWTTDTALVYMTGPSGLDSNKETGFYRKSSSGKHQIYYIGYDDENTYEAQIYLAEADSFTGPYTQKAQPVVLKGMIAGKNVYAMTSPSVVEYQGLLYMTFIGWNASPDKVTEVWIIGATSSDDGHTWSNYQMVDTKIGMEGQVTKTADGKFISVRTADYENREALYYSTATHPFGPWTENKNPILIQAISSFEKDEIIAPQITIDPITNKQYLYYTGADYQTGWWIMLAEQTTTVAN
ncbi:MAG: hypothetical protein LR008_02030 [Candidatus Pacebacteria bacterium]|nr:hypothetical protein [Candidatus Paceibacterota bacterium]